MQKKTVFFLTIDTTLRASDPLTFRKHLLPSYKNDSSWSNENFGQNNYDLHRKAAKISALSPNNSDKYSYLTGDDLGLKSSTAEQTRFDYSLLSKCLNKNFKEEEKEEGRLKILKNIEGKKKNN